MGFKVYRERRLPDGTISFSVGVAWEDGTHSHEEIAIPEDQCDDEQNVKRVIRDTLKDWKKGRPKRRIAGHVKAERAKDLSRIAGSEDPW